MGCAEPAERHRTRNLSGNEDKTARKTATTGNLAPIAGALRLLRPKAASLKRPARSIERPCQTCGTKRRNHRKLKRTTRLRWAANRGDVRPVNLICGCQMGAPAAATIAGAHPMTLLICQKSSKHPPQDGAQSGGASTRSHRSAAGARAILTSAHWGWEGISCARLRAPKPDAIDQCAAPDGARTIPRCGPDLRHRA
jgi:hypothetical protein